MYTSTRLRTYSGYAVLTWLFLMATAFSHAQLNADFQMNKTGGCSPQTVSFVNTTTGASASATYNWDFGNGTSSLIQTNVGATYKEERTYTVTLTVTDGGNVSSKQRTITVYKKPVADFATSSSGGCLPVNVTFTSGSSAGDGTIASYLWDFGDGTTREGAQLSQLSHSYDFAQKASVSLTITNSHGCYATIEKEAAITVMGGVKAGFSANKTGLCRTGEQVKFKNETQGTGSLSYLWDFGNGQTSTQKDPTVTYNTTGAFTVKLTVTTSEGCSNTATKESFVRVADFQTDFELPTVSCMAGQMLFVNKSLPAPDSSRWEPQGGTAVVTTNDSIAFTFTDAGQRTMKLTNYYGDCQTTLTKTFDVSGQPAMQPFDAVFATSCGAPATVNFNDKTPGAVQWAWNLDGDAANTTDATDRAPSFTYTRNGQYKVLLTVTNAAGCTDTISKRLTIRNQVVQIKVASSTSVTGGSISCEPFSVSFAAESTEEIESYSWSIDNGGPTSTEAQPQFSFDVLNKYVLRLRYTTISGCTGEVVYDNIAVYEKPEVEFSSTSGTTICGNTPVHFSPKVLSGTATEWNWDFGENSRSKSTAQNPSYKYTKGGTFDVTLIAGNGGCGDTVVLKNYITVLPPFPDIGTVTNTCVGDRGEVTFANASKNATKWEWNFGDGSAPLVLDANQATVKHTFSSTGAYNVVLTTTNGECVVKDSVTAYVLLRQNPVLTASRNQLCSSETLDLAISGVDKNPYTPRSLYKTTGLLYGDGSLFAGTGINPRATWASTYATTVGGLEIKDNLRAIVQSEHFGCYDTTNFVTVDVRGPVVAFDIADSTQCHNKPFVFLDKSKANNNVPIKTWEWSFGDNTTGTYSGGNAITHEYASPGRYMVTLKVTDNDGCSATFPSDSMFVQAWGPKAAASASDTSVMVNTTVNFTNLSNNFNSPGTQYKWFFTDGTSSTAENPSKTYTRGGMDTVRLVAFSSECADTAMLTVQVKVVNVSFTTTTRYIDGANCPPLLARFTNTSVNVDSVSWDFGDGSAAGSQRSPSHTFNKPGTYKIVLHGFNGTLRDSVWTYIFVAGPYATISADKLFGCMKETVTIRAQIKDATSFLWNMGDGTLKQTPDSFVVYEYGAPGVYQPSIILNDQSGCSSTFELVEKIVIDSLGVDLSTMNNEFCDTARVTFDPQVKSIAADRQGRELAYSWNFGTGRSSDVSTEKSPTFFFGNPGSYPVKLQIQSPFGCKAEAKVTIKVAETPKGTITGPDNVCLNAPAQFKGTVNTTSAVSWKWIFGNGNRPEVPEPEPQFFNETDTFNVRLIVKASGCSDTTSHRLIVRRIPDLKVTASKTDLCPGESTELMAEGGSSRIWSPATGLSSTTGRSPEASPRVSTLYKVTVSSDYGCTKTDSIQINVMTPFKLEVKDTSVCVGKSVELKASGGATYEWSGGDASEFNNVNVANPVVTPPADRTYTVKAWDALKCFDTTAKVKVKVNAAPSVSAGPDAEVLAASEYVLRPQASSDVVKWSWSPADYLSCADCPAPTAKPRSDVSYAVTVQNANGCQATDTINIHMMCDGQGQVFIPNVFTPNYDGKNDVFVIKGKGISNIKSIRIYNRWGDVVFMKTNFGIDDRSAGWDGFYKGRLVPTGTYVYVSEMQCGENVFQQKGTITVVY